MAHEILISVGSNIDKDKNTAFGLQKLNDVFDHLSLSPIYESEAVGFTGATFFNLVVRAMTELSIADVVRALKQIEVDAGRVKDGEKFADRVLDLDLLTYDEEVCQTPVVLPREEILYNAFVLRPMADLIPDALHPLEKKPYREIWQNYNNPKQKLWLADFSWSEHDPV